MSHYLLLHKPQVAQYTTPWWFRLIYGQTAFISIAQTRRKRQMWMTFGSGCSSLMEPSWTDPCSGEKVLRLGELRAVCPPGPMGVPPSHLHSDRMCVCGDYKLIVHGGPKGENHIRERRWDYRLLNVEDYTFRPPPRPRRMQMSVDWKKINKGKKEIKKKKRRWRPFVTFFGGKKTQILCPSWEKVKEFVLRSFFLSLGMSVACLSLAGCQMGCK